MTGTAALLIAAASSDVSAQELEPRAYSPSPSGVNFLGLGYLRSAGGVAVDPSLPLDNVDAEVNAASLSYLRTFGSFGRSASIGFVLPYSRADVSGDVFEQQRSLPYRVGRSPLASGGQPVRGPASIGKNSPPATPPPPWAPASWSWLRWGNALPIV